MNSEFFQYLLTAYSLALYQYGVGSVETRQAFEAVLFDVSVAVEHLPTRQVAELEDNTRACVQGIHERYIEWVVETQSQ